MRRARELKTVSPCGLIQESLKDDPWRVLVACILMNMTTGLTMRPHMWKLLEKYPTATKLAAANVDDVREIISKLGLSNRRSKALVEMSKMYLTRAWSTPMELPGCGKYATDSWKIFCTDQDVELRDLKDKELRRFVYWLESGIYVTQDKEV